jgi:hypothetical protein
MGESCALCKTGEPWCAQPFGGEAGVRAAKTSTRVATPTGEQRKLDLEREESHTCVLWLRVHVRPGEFQLTRSRVQKACGARDRIGTIDNCVSHRVQVVAQNGALQLK